MSLWKDAGDMGQLVVMAGCWGPGSGWQGLGVGVGVWGGVGGILRDNYDDDADVTR